MMTELDNDAVAVAALAVYALYLGVGFGLRTWVQWRRTGDTGWRGISGRFGSPEWWAGVLFTVALVAGVLGPITVSGAGGPGTPTPPALLGDDGELVRAIVRVPRGQGRALALALKEAVAVRGARRETGHVHVQMDVAELV